MEDYYNVKRLALVLAVQAEIEGMKATNILKQQNNESPVYNQEAFSDMADRLSNLAYAHNEQL